MTDDRSTPARRPAPRARIPAPAAPVQPVAVPAATPSGGDVYASSVVAPMQIVLGVGSGALVAVILTALNSNLWPIALLIFLVAAGVGAYLAPVAVDVADRRVTISQGRRDRDPLVIYVAEIRDAGLRDLTWAQCLGFGNVESDDRTTRLAVRPGSTLVLSLFDGQRLLVSVADPAAALRAIQAARPV